MLLVRPEQRRGPASRAAAAWCRRLYRSISVTIRREEARAEEQGETEPVIREEEGKRREGKGEEEREKGEKTTPDERQGGREEP